MTVMRRAVPTIPVTPGMLRHFAVLTVAITGCLAMFADGENRQLVEDKLKARQAQNQALRAQAEKGATLRTVGGLKIAKGTRVDHSGDSAPNSGSAPDGGGTIDPSGRYAQMNPPPAAGPAYGANPAYSGQPGPATEYGPRAGNPEFYSRKPKAPPARTPSQEEIDAMMAASRARSGSGGAPQEHDPDESGLV